MFPDPSDQLGVTRVKRRISIIVIAVLAAIPAGIATAQPAAACDRYPCHGACHVNRDYAYIGEDGMPYFGNGNPIECYY